MPIDRIPRIGRAIPIRKICLFLSLEISFQIVCAFSFSQIRWNPLPVREDRHAKIRGRVAVGKEGGRNKGKNGRLVAGSEVWLWQKNLSYAAARPISPIGPSAFAFSPRSVILNQKTGRLTLFPFREDNGEYSEKENLDIGLRVRTKSSDLWAQIDN